MLYTRRSPKSPNRVGIIHKKIKRMDTANKFQLFVSSLEKKKLSGSEESLVLTNSMEHLDKALNVFENVSKKLQIA